MFLSMDTSYGRTIKCTLKNDFIPTQVDRVVPQSVKVIINDAETLAKLAFYWTC